MVSYILSRDSIVNFKGKTQLAERGKISTACSIHRIFLFHDHVFSLGSLQMPTRRIRLPCKNIRKKFSLSTIQIQLFMLRRA